MRGFVLETVLSKGWRRGGEIRWPQEDAAEASKDLLRKGPAKGVRVLPTEGGLDPVVEMPESKLEPVGSSVGGGA